MNDPSQAMRPVAVVLAAGLGSRLQAVHSATPKGFVEIGGAPIIQRSLGALARAGVTEVVLVVGWLADQYRTLAATLSPPATCVTNAEYAVTGSLRSLLLGCAAVPGRDVVIVESDLLYEDRAAELLVAAASSDTLLVSGFTKSGDEVWAYNRTDRLEHLSKSPSRDRAPLGELVGLTRLSAATIAALSRAAAGLPPSAHYEDGLNAVADQCAIDLLHLPDLAWCEIDDEAHLERARATVWPRIQAAANRSPEP